MASGSGELRGARAVDQGDEQITQGGHNLWNLSGCPGYFAHPFAKEHG